MSSKTKTPHARSRLSLKHRLGHQHYKMRRKRENARKEMSLYGGIMACLSWHLTLCNFLASWFLRISGLYKFGHRQFHNIHVRHNRTTLTRLPEGFNNYRILHLSDLHLDLHPKFLPSLIKRIKGLKYDIAVITGDFRNDVHGSHDDCMRQLNLLIKEMTSPVYAVLGNHDYLAMVPIMESFGIRVLLNEHVTVSHNGDNLVLAGVDDPNIYQTDDLQRALHLAPENSCKILLSHSPAIYKTAAEHHVDLVLAGHTHGGQICLPGGIIIFRNDMSPRKLLHGSWRLDDTRGYTSAGTGACGIAVRFFCPGEIVIHELHSND